MKTSSQNEELYEDSCEDEDAKMAMLTRRYKKLAFQCDQRWEEEILEKTDFETSLQETIKSLTIVVNNPNI